VRRRGTPSVGSQALTTHTWGCTGEDVVSVRRAVARQVAGTQMGGRDARQGLLDGFRAYVTDAARLRLVLQPLVHDSGRTGVLAESVAKLLLGLDELQTDLVTVLLEKMFEHFLGGTAADPAADSGDGLVRLILLQLRWLDRLSEPAKVVGKLLELLGVAPTDVQRDVILALPEIVGDAEHKVHAGTGRAC
jgi:hypothetical protein